MRDFFDRCVLLNGFDILVAVVINRDGEEEDATEADEDKEVVVPQRVDVKV